MDAQRLQLVFADYARTLLGRYQVGDVLYRLTDQMVEVLDVAGAGVCIRDRSQRLRFVSASSPAVGAVEEGQIENQQGPCYDAYRTKQVVAITDLRRCTERWPQYVPIALDNGWSAVAGIPMMIRGECIGAVNLYHERSGSWREEDLDVAQLLADMASGYIANALTLSESRKVTQQLQHALDSRVVIEQAKGIIAAREDLDVNTAFEFLRKYARNHNRKLHSVAQDVVDGRLHLP